MRQADGTFKEITYDEAIDWTAKMLVKSRKTLMYGWASTSCQAMSIGHEIAEKVGGIVDNCATVCHGSSLIAIEDVGVPTCTPRSWRAPPCAFGTLDRMHKTFFTQFADDERLE